MRLFVAVLISWMALAQQPAKPVYNAGEQEIVAVMRTLRSVPDAERGAVTREVAKRIRGLKESPNRLRLANGVASLSTEGDFGKATLTEVARTLAEALREAPPAADKNGRPADPYFTLASLARYEGVAVEMDAPDYRKALEELEQLDAKRAAADFTLLDLSGKSWRLKELTGKVVLVNFWATWCPPCRKEMPDLEALSKKFAKKGLVVLAITDEERGKVEAFLKKDMPVTYPVLLDEGRKVAEQFGVEGIPKTFIYDREGRLAAQSIDMRTKGQFLELLAKAGLR